MGGILIFNYTFYNCLLILSLYFVIKLISNFFYNTKKFFYNPKTVPNILILNSSEVNYFMTSQFIIVNSFKTLDNFWLGYHNILFFIFYFFLVTNIIFIKLVKNYRYFNNQLNLIHNLALWFYVGLTSLLLIDNLITLLLLLEFIGVLYYFFFLEQASPEIRSFIKLKNMLNSYLWLSFFTLIFLFLAFLKICSEIGTLDFNEIAQLSNNVSGLSWFLLFIGFFFKLGIAGFHILKFEVYKHISSFYIIFFSLYTFYLNSAILFFIFVHFWSLFIIYEQQLLGFILFFNLLLLINGLRTYTFYQFLAFSTINTWSLMILFLSV